MKAIGDRAREVLDAKGLTLEQIIDFYLLPLLEARETKFFPWRRVTKRKTEQIIDRVEVVNLAIKATGLDFVRVNLVARANAVNFAGWITG